MKFLLGDPFFGPSPEMVSSLGSATGLPSSLCCTVGKAIGVVGLLVPFINLWVPGNSLLDAGVCRELEKGTIWNELHRLLSRNLGAYMNCMVTGEQVSGFFL